MRMLDFAPLPRSTIGFDRLFDLLDRATGFEPDDGFPLYDIEKTGEDAYRVTLAVPGFAPDEISIESQPNLMVVSGQKATDRGSGQYLHRGLTGRSFERRFDLADFVEVKGARLENGLLTIELQREVPEAMQPRRIEIAAGGAARGPGRIEGQQAA
jgi:molecular chaperone IbpA